MLDFDAVNDNPLQWTTYWAGRTIILQIGDDSIKAVWQTPTLAALHAHVNRSGDRSGMDMWTIALLQSDRASR